MPSSHYSNYEEFVRLTDDQLRQLADDCLKRFQASRSPVRDTPLILQAQLYMNELSRREDAAVAHRDFRMASESHTMEKWVIILIGLELLVAGASLIYGIWEGGRQGKSLAETATSTAKTATYLDSQTQSLTTMIQNTQHTVDAIGNLQKVQSDSLSAQKKTLHSIVIMNEVLQRQLDLAFDVSINVVADDEKKELIITNLTRTSIYLWGAQVGEDPPTKFPDERFVPPDTPYIFFVKPMYDLASATVPKGTDKRITNIFFLRGANGKPYVARGFIVQRWEGDVMKFLITTTSVKEEEWPSNVK